MKLFTFITTAMLLSATLAHAGREGNGGDVLICPNKKPELLDYYEARTLPKTKLKIDLGPTHLSVPEKIDYVLKRLARVSPYRAKYYGQLYSTFNNEVSFVPDANLKDIPDSDELVIPKGCELKQAAIQTTPKFPDDPRYTIDETIWKQMDNYSQAGLILHEIVYRDALQDNHINSIPTRKLNGLIASTYMETISTDQFREYLVAGNFKLYDLSTAKWPTEPGHIKKFWNFEISLNEKSSHVSQGTKLNMSSPYFKFILESFNQSSDLSSLVLRLFKAGSGEFLWKNEWIKVASTLESNGIHYLSVYKDGRLRSATLMQELRLPYKEGTLAFLPNEQIELDRNQNLIGATFQKPKSVLVNGRNLQVDTLMSFHVNGSLARSRLIAPTTFTVGNETYSFFNTIAFDENGGVAEARLSSPKKIKIGDKTFSLRRDQKVLFHPSGQIKQFYLEDSASLKYENRDVALAKYLITFDEYGRIRCGGLKVNKIIVTLFNQKVEAFGELCVNKNGNLTQASNMTAVLKIPDLDEPVKVSHISLSETTGLWKILVFDGDISINVQGQKMVVKDKVERYENGSVRTLKVANNSSYRLKAADFSEVIVSREDLVTLNEEGLVTNVNFAYN
ncbi:MAG: hypothetical protein AB7F59_00755 [Bdellovibrionales bacterium]